jgi:hypothetical protein
MSKFKPDLSAFMNPTPKAKGLNQVNKHGKMGAQLDDTGDIYDHTQGFFSKE